ncbi:MAG TPA: right-handed parallel beta-helix repeat-containing protein, partial [Thiolinea sp.]|nr:right-handed parallel beta-helix repeat-containing protein [Thiolinea sp.]
TDLGVQTYRTDGSNAVLNEVGGRAPAAIDAAANTSNQVLNITNFSFANGSVAQTIQPVTIAGGEISGVSFGFNFSTVVNTNDAGQGSLRQFLLNNKQLATEGLAQALPATLAASYPAGTETSIFMIPLNQLTADKALISLTSGALSLERANTSIDGRTQIANMGSGAIVLDASITNGLNLLGTATGSAVRDITVSHAAGSGIVLDDTDNAAIERVVVTNNSQYGIGLANDALNNRLVANTIANNNWAGIAHLGTGIGNTYSQNSIHDNGGLGIDLGVDGVTANDNLDTDTGPNKLLNYPEVAEGSSISSNGTKVLAYDFDLDVPSNPNGYRVEFFRNTAVDVSKHGEGEIYLGYVDITHAGGGKLNFKGSLNANQPVPANANIAVTLTEKTSATTLASTSEFSGVRNGSVSVCTDLINGTGADMTVNENAPVITYLEATDSNGNPITYVISGGADGSQFIIQDPDPGATLDCQTVIFRKPNIIGSRSSSLTKAAPVVIPGNYEIPTDSGGDNTYDLTITATVQGKDYVRPVTVGVQDVNEPPAIISDALTEVVEGKTGVALNVESFDPDAGDEEGQGIIYAISGGADRTRFKINPQTGELSFIETPDFEAPLDAGNDNTYDLDVQVMDDQGLSSVSSLKIAVADDKLNDGVNLQTKLLLQGPYLATTGLMEDGLRSLGLLPMSQPYTVKPFNYTGTEQLNLDLATVTGKDALVDWILVELRDPANPNTIVASKAALLQRDGDVVDASTGSSSLNFKVAAGNYLVSVRHRNHLGVRTANAVALGSAAASVDFSQATTKVAGSDARLESANLALLWAGDVNHDDRLILSGIGSDTTEIFNAILKAPNNSTLNSSYRLSGYLDSDVNMDGAALFIGPSNDTNVLLGNVILFPSNKDRNSNYIAVGSLAK